MFQNNGGGESRDIFADERKHRRRFRFTRYLLGGWFSGRFGLAVLVLFLVAGLGMMVYQKWYSPEAKVVQATVPDFRHPEAGRPLTAGEAGVASRFGEPLYLGDSGRPVVRLADGSGRREITPVEMEFPVGVLYEDVEGEGVMAPGPRGWGLWWDHGEAALDGLKTLAMDRKGWTGRQNEEIERALAGLETGVSLISEWDREPWIVGQGGRAADHMKAMMDAYPDAIPGYWALVPAQWRCDEEVEYNLRHGVTFGCPSIEVVNAVEAVWQEIGVVMELLSDIAELGRVRDQVTARQSSALNLDRSMDLAIADLLSVRDRLPRALLILELRAEKELLKMRHDFVED